MLLKSDFYSVQVASTWKGRNQALLRWTCNFLPSKIQPWEQFLFLTAHSQPDLNPVSHSEEAFCCCFLSVTYSFTLPHGLLWSQWEGVIDTPTLLNSDVNWILFSSIRQLFFIYTYHLHQDVMIMTHSRKIVRLRINCFHRML